MTRFLVQSRIVGPKAFAFSTRFVNTASRASGALPSEPDFPKAVCIVTSRRFIAATATRSHVWETGHPRKAGHVAVDRVL